MTDLVTRLGKLDSCVISDAMDRLGVKGVAFGLSRLSTRKKLHGRILTVKLEEAKGRTAERHLCTAAVDAAHPGDVIVIEHHSRADCAGWGGILSAAAVQKFLSGVIIDGMARDIDESDALGPPRLRQRRRPRHRPRAASSKRNSTRRSRSAASP